MADALLTIENLTKSFGDKLLFEDISFGINAGQKSALIARNGYGKSTLLNIIMTAAGQKGYNTLQDAGKIAFRGDLKLAYLPQSPEAYPKLMVRDFVYNVQRPETEDEWTFEQRMEEILSRMKVDTLLDRQMETLSGGEQKKVALCKLLMDDCNLLILDEPTNHLDIDMIEWLEEFLSRQRLAILMVTHDRYFLDNVCDNIYELDNSRLYHYKGRYDYYLEKKAEREANERAEVEKARSLYRTELEWMRRMPQARGTKAQARIDAFYELEAKAHTRFDDSRPQLTVKTERIGGKILELYNVCYHNLIDDYSYVFKRGEKIGIVGPNGVGKSTFLNIITEQLKPRKTLPRRSSWTTARACRHTSFSPTSASTAPHSTTTSATSAAASDAGSTCCRCSWPTPTSSSSTSPPTTSISTRCRFWSSSSRPIKAASSSSRTTARSWTTSLTTCWCSKAMAKSATTTPTTPSTACRRLSSNARSHNCNGKKSPNTNARRVRNARLHIKNKRNTRL